MDAHLARNRRAQHLAKRRHIEDILQAGAVRFHHDRERGELERDRHQLLRAQPLGE